MLQSAQTVRPAESAYLPATQVLQSASPLEFLNIPFAHGMQSAPPVPVYPLVHEHKALPEVLTEFAGHEAHAPDPEEALEVFAGHGVQAPGAPVYPAGQRLRHSDG